MESHNKHNPQPEVSPAEHGEVRYEQRDVRMRPLLAAVAALGAMVGIAVLAMAGLFGLLADQSQREPLALPSSSQPPIEGQLDQLRAQEEEVLTEYAWVDRQQGIVRIPIERAMKLMASEEGEVTNE